MSRKSIIRLTAFLLCLAAVGACLLWSASLALQIIGQTEAERWQQGNLSYIQQSAFIIEDRALDENGIKMIRRSIDQALVTESIEPAGEGARLWIDAYSGVTETSASHGGSNVSARTICTGGEFFTFNQIDMLSGWYYSDMDIMDDGVIIDKNLAWQLYGGFELAGMEISINGYPCVIVGVADHPRSDILADAYGDEPTVYLPMSLCDRIAATANITYYSLILPNPVDGFAEKVFSENSGLDEADFESIQNTGRFSVISNLKRVSETGSRVQRTTKVFFPWWENGARYAESWCTVLTVIAVFFTIWPAVYTVILIVIVIRNRRIIFLKVKTLFGRSGGNKETNSVMEEQNEQNET